MKIATRAQIGRIRKLLNEKKERDAAGLFVAEGSRIVSDIASGGHEVTSLFVSVSFLKKLCSQNLLSHFKEKRIPVYAVKDTEFGKISSLRHPEGILALVKQRDMSGRITPSEGEDLIVLCDGVQDPGNLGAIIRTAVAFGVDALFLTGESADIYNPKVVRASSGMVANIPIHACAYKELENFKRDGYSIFVSDLDTKNGKEIDKIKKLSSRSIIAFGAEGGGVSREICDQADTVFYIPINKKIESLNVASAAAIALYVFRRHICG